MFLDAQSCYGMLRIPGEPRGPQRGQPSHINSPPKLCKKVYHRGVLPHLTYAVLPLRHTGFVGAAQDHL